MSSKSGRRALMNVLKFTELWMNQVLKANKVNGPLTTMAAIQAIQKETGMSQEEILDMEADLTGQDRA